MHKYNNRFVVALVRIMPSIVKGMDIVVPAVFIGSMTTVMYVVAVMFLI